MLRPFLREEAGEWRIVGEANDGRVLFARVFDMAETADGDGQSSFVATLPAGPGWANALARIVLTGPEGSVEMDAGTGAVRGILRNWLEPGALPDAARVLPEPGLEVQVSRGVPTPEAWSR